MSGATPDDGRPFDPSRWAVVPGFDYLTDVTYHRAVGDEDTSNFR